jgi:hypothetical protein
MTQLKTLTARGSRSSFGDAIFEIKRPEVRCLNRVANMNEYQEIVKRIRESTTRFSVTITKGSGIGIKLVMPCEAPRERVTQRINGD